MMYNQGAYYRDLTWNSWSYKTVMLIWNLFKDIEFVSGGGSKASIGLQHWQSGRKSRYEAEES